MSVDQGAEGLEDSKAKAYLSLGEVLDMLKEQFPEVTIGKIRFFEGQGLLVPERTPSGYRKFYPADVERLRVIMSNQQERYVPLAAARTVTHEPAPVSPSVPIADAELDRDSESPVVEPDTDLGADRHPARRGRVTEDPVVVERPPRPSARSVGSQNVAPLRRPERYANSAPPPPKALEVQPPAVLPPAASAKAQEQALIDDRVYSQAELIEATGVDQALFADAVKQGFLRGRSIMGVVEYSADDREMLSALMTFASSGLDPRHVRVFVHAAQREVDLYLQATLPLLRRRPQVGVSAEEPFRRFAELDAAGETLRSVVVRRSLRDALDGTPTSR